MSEPSPDAARRWVSRAGEKLAHALTEFQVDVTGLRCADFGCSTGGFTDCLIQGGAESVIAIDTGYGVLDWTMRQHERVEVRERTNVLHADPPPDQVDLVVIDVGWTPQAKVLPVARRWITRGGRILTLIKPHYELTPADRRSLLLDGRLADEDAMRMRDETLESIKTMGFGVLGQTTSPIRGAKSGKGRKGSGNLEFLVLLTALEDTQKAPEEHHA